MSTSMSDLFLPGAGPVDDQAGTRTEGGKRW